MASNRFIDIRLLGDEQLARKFQRLPYQAQGRVFRPAVRKAARPVLQRARELVPVLTGALKKSLRIRALSRVRYAVGAVVETGTREQLGIDKDDKFFYPAVVEYRHTPYLRPAVDEDPEGVKAILAREIRAGLERIV